MRMCLLVSLASPCLGSFTLVQGGVLDLDQMHLLFGNFRDDPIPAGPRKEFLAVGQTVW